MENLSKNEMKELLGGMSNEDLIALSTRRLIEAGEVSVKVGDKLTSLKCNGVCGLIEPDK